MNSAAHKAEDFAPGESAGPALRALRERAGLSIEGLAGELGYSSATSVQHYENPKRYRKRRLPDEYVFRLIEVLEGRGSPPVTREEILALGDRMTERFRIFGRKVNRVPVRAWPRSKSDAMSSSRRPVRHVSMIDDIPPAAFGLEVPDETTELDRIAPPGSTVIIDPDHTTPEDWSFYAVWSQGRPRLGRFRANPNRFEPLAVDYHETIFDDGVGRVTVIGKIVRVVHDLN